MYTALRSYTLIVTLFMQLLTLKLIWELTQFTNVKNWSDFVKTSLVQCVLYGPWRKEAYCGWCWTSGEVGGGFTFSCSCQAWACGVIVRIAACAGWTRWCRLPPFCEAPPDVSSHLCDPFWVYRILRGAEK